MSDLYLPRNPESVNLSLKQTAKGFWYVDRMGASGATIKGMLKNFDELIKELSERLEHLNEGDYETQ